MWAPRPLGAERSPTTRVAQLKYFRFHAKQQCAARFEHARVSSEGGVSAMRTRRSPCMESNSVCEASAAAASCAQRIGGSPKRRSVLADVAPTGS
jgi:hypothetical protein